MSDSQTQKIRSKNMAAVKSFNTEPEIYIRKTLFSMGFRYRLNQKNLPGKPDIVLAKYKTVIFIHGCFWHKHTCALASTPKTNVEFWINKLNSNAIRDQKNIQSLLNLGWRVIIVWQCSIKGKHRMNEQILKQTLTSFICNSNSPLIEIDGNNT